MDIDEDDSDNLEEDTKYKIKLDAPQSEPAFDDSGDEGLDAFDDAPADDTDAFGGFGDEGGEDKPFDDEPFDADVEADEDEDPEKYIQQLSGKLGTSIRKYNDERGEPDFDLEKYAINSVISASHTSEMEEEDQKDIIRKVKTSGAADDNDDIDSDLDEPTDDGEGFGDEPVNDEGGFGDEGGLEEIDDLPSFTHNPDDFAADDLKRYYDATVTRNKDGLTGKVVRFDDGKLKVKISDGEHIGKIYFAYPSEITMADGLYESSKNSTFVEKTDMQDLIKGKLDEMAEPAIAPSPVKTPTETPTKKPRRTRIFQPNPGVKTPAKMKSDGTDIK